MVVVIQVGHEARAAAHSSVATLELLPVYKAKNKMVSHHRTHHRNQVLRKPFIVLLILFMKNVIEMDKYWHIWYQIKA